MEKNYIEIADKLEQMQKDKNEGRGIDCIRTLSLFLRYDRYESACAVVNNEWDKISSYPDIAEYLIEQHMFNPTKF